MKTVEITHTDPVHQCTAGDIHRVPDEDAQTLVHDDVARYVPKSRWKALRDAEIALQRAQGVVGRITNDGTSFMPDGSKETVHRRKKNQKDLAEVVSRNVPRESKADRIKRQRERSGVQNVTIQRISDSVTFKVWGVHPSPMGFDNGIFFLVYADKDRRWRWVDSDKYRPYVDPPHLPDSSHAEDY